MFSVLRYETKWGSIFKEEDERKVMATPRGVSVTNCVDFVRLLQFTRPFLVAPKWGLFGIWKDSGDARFELVFQRLPELSVDETSLSCEFLSRPWKLR
jgi:hypothetical protein